MQQKSIGASLTGLLRECVNRDAHKAHGILSGLLSKPNWNDDDFYDYTLSTHGIKSALASVSIMDLSTIAATLEQAGKARDEATIQSTTPNLLAGLTQLIEDTSSEVEKVFVGTGSNDLLFQQLTILGDACSRFNKKDARGALSELDKYEWSEDVTLLISNLNACMPHSEFEKMSELMQPYLAD